MYSSVFCVTMMCVHASGKWRKAMEWRKGAIINGDTPEQQIEAEKRKDISEKSVNF